jgi:hypothetical protein
MARQNSRSLSYWNAISLSIQPYDFLGLGATEVVTTAIEQGAESKFEVLKAAREWKWPTITYCCGLAACYSFRGAFETVS